MREADVKLDSDQYIEFGMAAFYLERFDYADRLATEILSQGSENVKGLLLKGLTLYGQKKFSEAKRTFQKAKALRPDSPTIVRYLKAAEDQVQDQNQQIKTQATEYAVVNVPDSVLESDSAAAAKRRWPRRTCNFEMIVNDFDQMTALAAKVRSLSAG